MLCKSTVILTLETSLLQDLLEMKEQREHSPVTIAELDVQSLAQDGVLTKDFDIALQMHLDPTNIHYQEGRSRNGEQVAEGKTKYTWILAK